MKDLDDLSDFWQDLPTTIVTKDSRVRGRSNLDPQETSSTTGYLRKALWLLERPPQHRLGLGLRRVSVELHRIRPI